MVATRTIDDTVLVVGGGLVGGMFALMLRQEGFNVEMHERRPDFRKEDIAIEGGAHGQLTNTTKRSINLALSYRGICALEQVGLKHEVMKLVIPMKGRAVHLQGKEGFTLQPYGTADQAINSVGRTELNELLLTQAEKAGVKIVFESKLESISRDGVATFTNANGVVEAIKPQAVFGSDGAFSAVRDQMSRLCHLDFNRKYVPHGYKELTIPADPKTGDFQMFPNALHIWPRHDFMMIALPNPDKTFTCTLFAPFEGPDGLETIKRGGEASVRKYFERNFADSIPFFQGNHISEFMSNPSSPLLTCRLAPWSVVTEEGAKVALLGDAAHAIVPFYGQGMNAGFEDCLVLLECLREANNNIALAIKNYDRIRRPAGNGIADLSLNNYHEMSSKTASPMFQLKRKVDKFLHSLFPQSWIPLYTMVSFTRIPYNEVVERAQRQDKILNTAGSIFRYSAVAAAAAALYLSHSEHGTTVRNAFDRTFMSFFPSVELKGLFSSSAAKQ
uniref:Kynurenine 3-monooxygenase n=1 Tax=Palpitomonas bilix TaxID=652834 RepID=A0A7S3FYI7_9EUKA